jgi:hypothetical protein
MWYDSVLESLKFGSARPQAGRVRAARTRLAVELLEDRCLLSSYSFKLIADTGPSSPYGGLEVGQAINDLGDVAFEANLRSGGAGIFTRHSDGSQGPIIAITSDLIRDFYLSPYMNDSGTVAFGADLRDGRQVIFTGRGQELTPIADNGPDSPLSSLPPPAARVGSDGTVCFQALLSSGGKGFFLGDGGLLSILYVTGGRYSAFPGSPASKVHGDNTVAFRATLTGGPDGVFRGDGLHTETIVTAGNTYSSFLGSEINDAGTVGIIANLTAGGQAIVIAKDGTLTTFVDTSGPFSHVAEGKLSISNLEGAVFGADLAAGGTGIFDGPDPVADKILATGDPFDGSTVVGFPVNYLNPRGRNNEGQVIFRVNLADGRTVLVRADPDNAPVQAGPTALPFGDIGFDPAFVSVTLSASGPMSPWSIPQSTGPSRLFWRDPDGISLPPVALGEGQPERPHVAGSPVSSHAATRAVLDSLFADFGEEVLPITDK